MTRGTVVKLVIVVALVVVVVVGVSMFRGKAATVPGTSAP